MTKEDIIRMAREANGGPNLREPTMDVVEVFKRFAALVAAKEREACAKVCNALQDCGPENGCCPTYWNEALEKAEAVIRARENT